MAADNEVRQRTTASSASKTAANGSSSSSSNGGADSKASPGSSGIGLTILDILRALVGIAVISTLSSWFVTGGRSYVWGYDRKPLPWWTTVSGWKIHMASPIELTLEQLAAYDGSDADKPIYLAINRTIYDVSASPAVYGPGGFYAKLAAKDASRSFVTTCFDPQEDLVPYLGGVEEVFVPLWVSQKATKAELEQSDDEAGTVGMPALMESIRKKLGRRKMRKLREEVYEEAKEKVREKISNWESMFQKKGYPVVGRVVGVDDTDESKWKDLKFCEDALKQRPAAADSLMRAVKLSTGSEKIDISKMGGGAAVREIMEEGERAKNLKKTRKQRAEERKAKSAAEAEASKAAAAAEPAPSEHTDPRAFARHEDMMKAGKWGAENYPIEDQPMPWEI